jgi:hypothetical protein
MASQNEHPAATTENQPDKVEMPQRPTLGYLIRFPDKEARLRAVMILGEVGLPYCGFPDDLYGVRYGLMNKHIEALQRENVPFEVVA